MLLGFISIDYRVLDIPSYTNEKTSIVYFSDVNFIESGENRDISPDYKALSDDQQVQNLRIFPNFPQGIRNYYTLKLSQEKG